VGHALHGRHSYISLQIHAGTSPVVVAALAGNSAEVIWRHYAREFDRARTAAGLPLADALMLARATVAQYGAPTVHPRTPTPADGLEAKNGETPLG